MLGRAGWAAAAVATLSCSGGPPPQDGEFVALANAYIEEFLERYPEHATALGDHRYDGLLTDRSAAAIEDAAAWNKRTLHSMRGIDPARLSPANAVDFEILRNQIEFAVWSAEALREHEWNPMRYGVGAAFYSLLARDFAPLEDRLTSLGRRLGEIQGVLDAARENLANPPRIHTETAIRQNQGAISLLRDDLEPFLDEVPAMRAELEPARAAAIAALEDHGRWLQDDLLPRADGDFRIGRERYRRKLAYTLHSDLSMETILERATKRLAELQDELYETALPLYRDLPKAASGPSEEDRRGVIRAILGHLADSHPTDASIVEDARQSLEDVTAFTRERRLVSVPEQPLRIIVMPEFRRGVSTAYCDSPGPLEDGGETFYAISPTPDSWSAERKLSFYREYNDDMLRDLTVHEAIPGHYLQIAHSNRATAPTKVRSIFYSGTFVEGWAVYSEQIMVEHGYGGRRFKMQQLKMLTRAVINSILDQRINAGDMSEEQAMALMLGEGYQEDGEAAGKWIRAQLTSAQLSTYFVGIAEHNDLRREWERRKGPIEDWQAYHDKVLSFGSPPAKFLHGLLGL